MRDAILTSLIQIERAEQVRILYAVEAGSRVWGFASPDSDWDVRFLYLRPPEWYLSIQDRRNVLEYPRSPHHLDVSGWDLRKALQLFAKSNPPLLEWLRSPIVYYRAFSAVDRLQALMARYVSPATCLMHYLGMSEGNYREYLQGEQVYVKKYLYVLRPLLACRWIETHHTLPPVDFRHLIDDQLPHTTLPELHAIVTTLLDRKCAGDDLASGPSIPTLNLYIEAEIARLRTVSRGLPMAAAPDREGLNQIFRAVLMEAWPGISLYNAIGERLHDPLPTGFQTLGAIRHLRQLRPSPRR